MRHRRKKLNSLTWYGDRDLDSRMIAVRLPGPAAANSYITAAAEAEYDVMFSLYTWRCGVLVSSQSLLLCSF